MKLRDLKGLGPKSEACLKAGGISSKEELESIGAVSAFIKLKEADDSKPNLNFLYAMVGALEAPPIGPILQKRIKAGC